MLDGWRWTWATTGMVMFVGFLGDATTTPRSTAATVLFFICAFLGLGIFVLAMAFPRMLPGRSKAERDENEREQQRHDSEVNLEARKENVRRNVTGRLMFSHGDSDRRRHTDAMNRLAAALERQAERGNRNDDTSA